MTTAIFRGGGAGPAAWIVASSQILLRERERWVLWLPVFLGTGAGLYFALPAEPPPVLVLSFLGVTLAGVLASLVVPWPWLRSLLPPALALAVFATGIAVAQWRTHDVAAPVLGRDLDYVRVTGVAGAVEPGPRGPRVVVEAPVIEGLAPADTPARIRLRLRSDASAVRPGDGLGVVARLTPPPGASYPGGYDFARTAWFEGLGGVGYAVGRTSIEPEPPGGGVFARFARAIEAARVGIAERITGAIPGPSGAVAAALATGLRGDIPEGTAQAMRDSGLAHLLAISGLHVGLVAGFVYAAIRSALALIPSVALRRPIKKWAAVVAIVAAGFYLMLAGATVPTQRAFIMTGLVLLAVLLDRRGISLRLLAWAAAVIILLRPEAVLGVSFQMSFAAALALVAVYEALAGRFRSTLGQGGPVTRTALYIGAVGLTTLVAGLATAPFAIFHFNRIALFGMVANLVAVPIAALAVMPLVVLTLVAIPFGAEGLVLPPLGLAVSAVLWVADAVAAWPGAAVTVPAMSLAGLLAVVAGGLWLCLWRERWRLAGVVGVVAGLATMGAERPPDVLVSDSARLVAVRGLSDTGEDTLYLSDGRRDSFVRDVWTRRIVPERIGRFPAPGEEDGPLRCDALGCVASIGASTVALVTDPRAAAEDCALAQAVVATVPLREACEGPLVVIDRFDVWRHGAHAVWLDEGRVWRSRGDVRLRPWTRWFSWDRALAPPEETAEGETVSTSGSDPRDGPAP